MTRPAATRRTAGALPVALLALLAGLTACTGGDDDEPAPEPSTPSPTASAEEPPPPAPKAGSCYRLDVADATAPTSEAEPVSCEKKHTARTLAVGTVGDLVDEPDVAVDDPAVQRRLAQRCPKEMARFVGGDQIDRNLSRFVAIWFTPTLADAARGADWYRCDVVAVADSEDLLPLPSDRRLRGVLDRNGALDTFGTCGTARPGTKDFERVACARKHSWRALVTLRISDAEKYPGAKKARTSQDDECRDYVAERSEGASEVDYGWEWPTKQQWRAGQRYGFCWAQV